MTATAIESSVLESLDFEIACQVVSTVFIGGVKVHERPDCTRPATHTATIHQAADCSIIEKFICEQCIPRFFNDGCINCTETNRLTNLVRLPKAS